MALQLRPVTLSVAGSKVREWHRTHRKPLSGLWAVGCEEDGRLCGVAIVGRPVARMLQDGYTAEVTRVATDGTRNACSLLLGACRRAAFALGFRRVVTYTAATEPGSSLKAAGFRRVAEVPGREWDRESRPRLALGTEFDKVRWEAP